MLTGVVSIFEYNRCFLRRKEIRNSQFIKVIKIAPRCQEPSKVSPRILLVQQPAKIPFLGSPSFYDFSHRKFFTRM